MNYPYTRSQLLWPSYERERQGVFFLRGFDQPEIEIVHDRAPKQLLCTFSPFLSSDFSVHLNRGKVTKRWLKHFTPEITRRPNLKIVQFDSATPTL